MARDELDLSDYRPSRLPRVLMIASALAIVAVAAWFFAPILLASYSKATATAAVGPKGVRPEQTRAASRSVAPVAPAEDTASAPVTTATATRNDDTASVPAAPRATDSKAAAPWPTDLPAWPQPQPTAAAPAAPPPALPAAQAPPAEAANSNTIQLASVTPADTNADNGVNADTPANPDLPANVPLPRSRPSRQIAARLAIPLPRPRPQIEADVPTPEMKAFELQVDRMR